MIRIETLEGLVLSKVCKEVSPPKYESIFKKNKLLDGSYHIQIIGEPIKYIEFNVISNQIQIEKIDLMEAIGEHLRLIEHERIFIGLIDNKVDWKRLTIGYVNREKRLYEGNIKIIVTDVGDGK
ncbi:hypothetical protein [Tissierella sp.]|uniref:hypothetical protein n=1 Tax=Tissierella sp. TaxID=41274 RepID=UPI0030447835